MFFWVSQHTTNFIVKTWDYHASLTNHACKKTEPKVNARAQFHSQVSIVWPCRSSSLSLSLKLSEDTRDGGPDESTRGGGPDGDTSACTGSMVGIRCGGQCLSDSFSHSHPLSLLSLPSLFIFPFSHNRNRLPERAATHAVGGTSSSIPVY